MLTTSPVFNGVFKGTIAPLTVAANGTYSYDTPIPVPGAVNLSLSAEGDSTDFYADNVKYFNSTANNGYSGDLEIAMIPDSIRTEILGETVDANGALIFLKTLISVYLSKKYGVDIKEEHLEIAKNNKVS